MMASPKRRPAPRHALVTGASQGLGRAIAEECASRGMDLFLTSLPDGGLPNVARDIAQKWSVRVDWYEVDLTEEDAVGSLVEVVRQTGVRPDLLVNNAGIGSLGAFSDGCIDGHDAVVQLNVLALVRLTHCLVPDLEAAGAAGILNVASLGAFFPMVCLPVYSATKSFVLTFSLALREELRGRISVSTLCPNAIRNDRETEAYVDNLPFYCGWACLYPHDIARIALDGLFRGKAIIVPGAVNKVLRALGPLVPRVLATRVIRRLWGGFDAGPQHAETIRT